MTKRGSAGGIFPAGMNVDLDIIPDDSEETVPFTVADELQLDRLSKLRTVLDRTKIHNEQIKRSSGVVVIKTFPWVFYVFDVLWMACGDKLQSLTPEQERRYIDLLNTIEDDPELQDTIMAAFSRSELPGVKMILDVELTGEL